MTAPAYPIQDAEGLRLVGSLPEQPHVNPSGYIDAIYEKAWLAHYAPFKLGSELTALCIECGGSAYYYLSKFGKTPGSDGVPQHEDASYNYACLDCQDGQALYKITGEVELKQVRKLVDAVFYPGGDDAVYPQGVIESYHDFVGYFAELQGYDDSMWLCVAPAERVKG